MSSNHRNISTNMRTSMRMRTIRITTVKRKKKRPLSPTLVETQSSSWMKKVMVTYTKTLLMSSPTSKNMAMTNSSSKLKDLT